MKILLKITLFTAVLFLVGCASTKSHVGCEKLLTVGQSTVADAERLCGKPTVVTVNSNGTTLVVFSQSKVTVRPETLIPFVGLFVGGADAKSNTLTLVFENNVLKSHSYTDTSVSTKL